MTEKEVKVEDLKNMFNGLIDDPTKLDIDKEMEDLKIPEEEDFLK
ncbi:MAG: hypothetical protein ACO3CQ_04760 [Candidatus Nanopelagicaceae bacterium]